jgi:hypothetical protein
MEHYYVYSYTNKTQFISSADPLALSVYIKIKETTHSGASMCLGEMPKCLGRWMLKKRKPVRSISWIS